jgi:CheY-like chemotaxis protein
MKILIAEDDEFSRLLLATTLARLGHEVAEAGDGAQAWERYQQGDCRLIISDWMMPGLDGLELCRRIRAGRPEPYTYFILLTAREGKGDILKGMEAGADDFVSKPFDEELLAARLRVAGRILELQAANRKLGQLVPICSYCKKVRDDASFWQELDLYVMEHSDLLLSHGICPDCYERVLKPELETLRLKPGPLPGP